MQKVLMRKRILKIQEIVGKKIDIFWSFDNSILYNFQACPPNSISICHIVDLNQDFQFEKAATTANICFGTSSFIVDKLKKSNSKSFFINHGVGHLPETQSVKWVQNFDKPLVIGYAGNLNIPYFDWELFAKLIDNNKDCDFHLVGPWSLDHRNSFLNGRSNVKWLGVVDSQELPDFYNSADILTVTYKADEHKEQLSNPHKFMEYLASGKVILSTYTDQYADLKDLIVMSDRDGEFLALFSTIKKSIKKFNSENLVNRRIAFASENSYFKQIERIEKILRDNL
ncbi:MAG: glycosyltransferase [Bacteroidota bacterium]